MSTENPETTLCDIAKRKANIADRLGNRLENFKGNTCSEKFQMQVVS